MHPEGLDQPVAPAGGQSVQGGQFAGGEVLDEGGVGQQPQGRQMVRAVDQRGVGHDAVVDELEQPAGPADGVGGLRERHGQAHRGAGAGQGRAEHGEALRGEGPGDEQVRLRDVEVGEDVTVEIRLDVVGHRGAQGDEGALPGQLPGGGLAQFGDGRPGQRRCGQDQVQQLSS